MTRPATTLTPLLLLIAGPLLLLAAVFAYAVYHVLHQVLAHAEFHNVGTDAALNAMVDRQFSWIAALLGVAFCLAVMVLQRIVVTPLKALTRAAAIPEFAFAPIRTSGVIAREIGVLAKTLATSIAAHQASLRTLKQQLERFDLATRGAAEVIWDIDLASGHAAFSPRLAELLDLPPDAIPQLVDEFDALIHPADRAGYKAVALGHLRDRAPYHCEFRLRRANGEYCWVMSRGQALWNAEGRATRVAGSLTNMTEQHALQSITQAINAKMTEIIANTPGIIFEFIQAPDGQGYFESTSPLLHELFGLDPTPGFQKIENLLSNVVAEDLPALLASIDRATRETCIWLHEFRCKRDDGRVLWLEGRSQPRLLADKTVKFTGTLVDITARKTAEQALIAARDAADLATRAKSDFLATMSHEIRTPLNGVLGCTEILLTTPLTPDQRGLAETVAQRGAALLALLNAILDLSKLEAGDRSLERLIIGPRELCAEVIELFAPLACEKHLELTLRWDPLAPAVIESDATAMRQILTNLLGNALKFTASGGVIVTATITAEGALRIAVQDTGIGIAAENHQAIFNKFTQADTTTTRRFGGTGLGLTISQKLALALGGEIGVSSTPGEGSTFWFTVPRGTDLEVTETPPSALAERTALVLSAYGPRRESLIVELQTLGLKVWAADSLTAARVTLATQAPSLVLFDYAWPECDSLTLTAALRAASPGARLIPLCTVREISALDRSQFSASLRQPVTRRGTLVEALLQALEGADDVATHRASEMSVSP